MTLSGDVIAVDAVFARFQKYSRLALGYVVKSDGVAV